MCVHILSSVLAMRADCRNADDAIWKQDQGIEWASKAGEHYRFYMVVESKEMHGGKAYTLSDFLKLAEGL